MSSTHTQQHHHPVRGFARRAAAPLAGILAATAAVTAIGLGIAPTPADADPGETFVALGTSQLVQSEDLSAILIPLDTASVTAGVDHDFSSCLGEGNSWTSVVPGAQAPFSVTWTSSTREGEGFSESISQAATERAAKRHSAALVKLGIRGCQGSHSPWDFHYGPTTTERIGSGTATWALSYRGNSKHADGGVAVIRKGTTVGIVQVTGSWEDSPEQLMESVAKISVSRLR